ncbi:hypothetical protein DBR27_00010 [Flavobacterium sp. HMWF030]|nr:hypothetical protein DBR27_00010 [Flavobacterium sp. HMWF030]
MYKSETPSIIALQEKKKRNAYRTGWNSEVFFTVQSGNSTCVFFCFILINLASCIFYSAPSKLK